MKKKVLLFFAICVVMFTISCKKDNESPNPKAVKYEITGSFSGKLTIVYSDNVNGNTTLTGVSLPWSKEVNLGSNVLAIGIGGQGATAGVAGQTATLKIYVAGKVVKSSNATAGANGEILIPTLAYTF